MLFTAVFATFIMACPLHITNKLLRQSFMCLQAGEMEMSFLTQVVIDEVCREGGLLVFPASVHAGIGVRRIHRENVGADSHQLCLPH